MLIYDGRPLLLTLDVTIDASTVTTLRDQSSNVAGSCVFEYAIVHSDLQSHHCISTLEKLALICIAYMRADPPQCPLTDSQNMFLNRMRVLAEHSSLSADLRFYIKDIIELHAAADTSSFRMYLEPTIILNHSSTFKRHSVIVLLGAPGTGKSTLGRALHRARSIEAFVDIGHRLLQRGELLRYKKLPTPSRKQFLRGQAQMLIEKELSQYLRTSGELPLMITCIKETQDVYDLIAMLKKLREREGPSCSLNAQAFYLHNDQMVRTCFVVLQK
jgi:hypothetical protein